MTTWQQHVPDYMPCHYGGSRLSFRGPRKRLRGDFVAFIGGTETFGRYVEDPFPDLVQDMLGVRTVNFGFGNAGLDMFLNDETVMDACVRANVTVVQVLGAHNLTNRFYTVHPRRNDRFVKASAMLRAIYPEIDFTEFHFTRHMLHRLIEISPSRFALVLNELQRLWVERMNMLTTRIGEDIVLAWIGTRHSQASCSTIEDGDPLFVTEQMVSALRGKVRGMAEMTYDPKGKLACKDGKLFPRGEASIARHVPGATDHEGLALEISTLIGPLRLRQDAAGRDALRARYRAG